jgi:hypothetical protein
MWQAKPAQQALLQSSIQFIHHGRHIAGNHLADKALTQIESIKE